LVFCPLQLILIYFRSINKITAQVNANISGESGYLLLRPATICCLSTSADRHEITEYC
jgi:hypothetical protein